MFENSNEISKINFYPFQTQLITIHYNFETVLHSFSSYKEIAVIKGIACCIIPLSLLQFMAA